MDEEPQGVVLAACRRLLRPVIRLLLRHGVMQRDFAELCKEIYVDVATTDYGLQGRPTNVSRTALLTGLDRKEVKRLREQSESRATDVPHRGRQDRLARVLSGWHQDAEFMTNDAPRALPLESEDGTPSFTALARRYGGDIAVSVLLKELKRAGAVVESDGALRAVRRYYMPQATDAAALQRAGGVLEDVGNTVVHNLHRPRSAPSRFEGRATNPLVAVSAVREFREYVEQRGQQFLEDVDAWLTAHEAPAGDETATRLGIGVYWIQDVDNYKEPADAE